MANLYVIRFQDGKSSAPLEASEIIKRIHRGELKEEDDLSLYPNQFALNVRDFPEFEEEFRNVEQTMLNDANKKIETVHEEKTTVFVPPVEIANDSKADELKEAEIKADRLKSEVIDRELKALEEQAAKESELQKTEEAQQKAKEEAIHKELKELEAKRIQEEKEEIVRKKKEEEELAKAIEKTKLLEVSLAKEKAAEAERLKQKKKQEDLEKALAQEKALANERALAKERALEKERALAKEKAHAQEKALALAKEIALAKERAKAEEEEVLRKAREALALREVKAPLAPIDTPEDFAIDESKQSQKTVVFERPKELLVNEGPIESPKATKNKFGFQVPKKSFLIMVLLAIVAYEMVFEGDDTKDNLRSEVVMVAVRPQLPGGGAEKVDPELSVKIYAKALKPYLEDTVQGYRKAVDGFQLSLRYDPQNVKSLAMLASSYLNLIDSSNKDENTFSVINKLIELSRLKQLDLVETLIAEVEFLASSQRYDAGIQRLIEYSKVSGKFDPILYYYLGWLYSQKGEYGNAMKYLNLIPASALPLPKLYALRAYLHEENREFDEATAEYKRALTINPKHAKSILGLVRISEKKGELKKSVTLVEFLVSNPSFQSPKEYVRSLIYRSKLALLYQRPEDAIHALERAINIDPKNEDLRLEYYTLMSDSGKNPKYRSLAQMYALVLDGDRNRKAGKIQEATAVFLQAQDSFPKSVVPYVKMGDLFYQIGEYGRAQSNYKKALTINPKAGETAIKLIDSLIHNHDWEDAQKYLGGYRNHPKLKSAIDRLAGDLAYYQGNYSQAVIFYKKAMARDSIDTDVYSSYANTLRETDQCKDAQFFYSLSQRLDPFNYQAILGAARCLLKTDGVNQAVARIQNELAKLPKARPDLLVGIAEIYYLDHQDDKALQFTSQAKEIDSDYADTYRIEGNIYQRQMIGRRDAKKKALEALKAYSDRKPSDPTGYIERFKIFMKDSNFDKSAEELNRVFEVSPRYPELHYLRAQMFGKMGRAKDALGELEQELKLNPRFVRGLVEQGNVLLKSNNLDDAQKSFIKAMEIDPRSAEAKLGAGYVNYLKRQFPSAIALFQAALSLDKGNPEIYKKMGLAYRDSGDAVRAASSFQSYLDLAPDAPDRADYEQYRK